MFALPPWIKNLLASKTPFALEAAAAFLRASGSTARAFARSPENACRILAYHQTPPEHADAFRKQMEWLSRNRQVVSLAEMVSRIQENDITSKNLVAITFDDGFANNYEVAVPILQSLGMSACFFISTDFIDLAGKGSKALRQWEERVYRFTRAAEPMDWEQVRSLRGKGFEIGSHTVSHARLSQLAPRDLEKEIREANDRLQRECGQIPSFFAYPYGKSNFSPQSIRPSIMKVGQFLAAFSTERGWNTFSTSIDWLHRDSMEPSFSRYLLEAFLSGYFDKPPK